jgi:hypothetical protein
MREIFTLFLAPGGGGDEFLCAFVRVQYCSVDMTSERR